MKAKDLRIGNYVSTPSGIQKVIHIEEECFYTKDFKNKWAEIKPITLTEEWLEKFGMAMPINEGIYSAKEARYDGWCFGFCKVQQTLIDANYTWDCFDFFQDSNGFWFPFLNTYTNINYVHEFQNLYFVLTKTELELATAGRSLKASE